jgi:meso-butanediol dehydrogenase/(S,S)-butanediol dehydrogenase/diacetyl reductase
VSDPANIDDTPGPLLKDRVSVITGAGGAIGAAAAELFARHGSHVVIVEIEADLAKTALERVQSVGGSGETVVMDVCDDDAVLSLRDQVLQSHGRCDVLVNNVGHFIRNTPDFVSSDPTMWKQLYDINLHHVFTATHAFLPSMIARRSGSIINVSSVEGLRGYPPDPVYGAFKAAVVQFTRSLGVQVGRDGVRVNGIAPDLTNALQVPYDAIIPPEQLRLWPIWAPVGRMGVGADQARALLFLASDLSSFVTGHTIPVDGGSGAAGGWFRTDGRPERIWTNRPIAP